MKRRMETENEYKDNEEYLVGTAGPIQGFCPFLEEIMLTTHLLGGHVP